MSEDGELSEVSGALDDNESFVVDRNCSGIIPNEDLIDKDTEESSQDSVSITPQSDWSKRMRKRLLGDTNPTEEPQNKRRRAANLCFNCRGEHSISQCPEPKDFAAIRKNKAEFLSEKQTVQNGNGGRISKITEQDAKFKPGRLSQNLRSALNLGPDDIPEWIYRMRRMGFHGGYPPGYLRKSLKHEFGTLKIFSDDAKKNDEIDEEPRPAPTIQSEKVHFYMGFNKTYGALRDRERGQFEVPPFDIFCEMLQTEVTKDHEYSEKNRIRDERQQRLELQKLREEEIKNQIDDIVVVDRSKTEEVEEVVTPRKSKETTPEREEGRMGESIHQLIGTPIVSHRDENGSVIEYTTPSLEAFAVGILPFEAKEEEKPRGIFKRIMSTLRGIVKKDDDDDDEKKKKKD
ncbi:unnamed protein product [Caenorhabditis brenneri]